MSIAQGTTYYDYPQVQLTDRPTFADFNPAFADIDAKLHGLITGAETDEQAIADLGTAVGNLSTQLGGVSEVTNAAKTKADSNEEAIALLATQVSQNTTKLGTKIDANAIAEPYDAASTYAVGDVVSYQGQRYRCITAVVDAEPFDATKWTGEDVQTVLDRIATPAASDVTLTPITGMTATNVQDGIAELKSELSIDTETVTINPSVTSGSIECEIYGKLVHVYVNAEASYTQYAWTDIGTLPANVRPANNHNLYCYDGLMLQILTGGTIRVYNYSSNTNQGVTADIMYLIN